MTEDDAPLTVRWMVRQYGFDRAEVESWVQDLHFNWQLSVKALDESGDVVGMLNMSDYRIEEETPQILIDKPELIKSLNAQRYIAVFSFIVAEKYRGTRLNYDMLMSVMPELKANYDFIFIPVLHRLKTHQYWQRWGVKEFYRDEDCVCYKLDFKRKDMATSETFDLGAYMSNSIAAIMAKAYRNVLSNPREAKFAYRMQTLFQKSEKRRKKIQEAEGLEVPPFLISSISTQCNLHCKGCYARSNGIAEDKESDQKKTLTPQQWCDIFTEAATMGINFSLLAGGEPLMRKDILEGIAEVKDMIFPIFTNGTLIGPTYLEFFRQHLNMVPIISIEGTAVGTDERRGKGVYRRAMQSMEMLKGEDLFFGTSITVTTENYRHVTSSEFIDTLRSYGCKIVFYVEYVPTEPGTEHLAFADEHVAEMETLLVERRQAYSDIIFLSFPGDEKALGGCLASGRGFFHIAPDGSAEPCPFSPFSDSNVAEMGMRAALQSPLFRKIRAARALGWEHTGGCTLFEHREEIEKM